MRKLKLTQKLLISLALVFSLCVALSQFALGAGAMQPAISTTKMTNKGANPNNNTVIVGKMMVSGTNVGTLLQAVAYAAERGWDTNVYQVSGAPGATQVYYNRAFRWGALTGTTTNYYKGNTSDAEFQDIWEDVQYMYQVNVNGVGTIYKYGTAETIDSIPDFPEPGEIGGGTGGGASIEATVSTGEGTWDTANSTWNIPGETTGTATIELPEGWVFENILTDGVGSVTKDGAKATVSSLTNASFTSMAKIVNAEENLIAYIGFDKLSLLESKKEAAEASLAALAGFQTTVTSATIDAAQEAYEAAIADVAAYTTAGGSSASLAQIGLINTVKGTIDAAVVKILKEGITASLIEDKYDRIETVSNTTVVNYIATETSFTVTIPAIATCTGITGVTVTDDTTLTVAGTVADNTTISLTHDYGSKTTYTVKFVQCALVTFDTTGGTVTMNGATFANGDATLTSLSKVWTVTAVPSPGRIIDTLKIDGVSFTSGHNKTFNTSKGYLVTATFNLAASVVVAEDFGKAAVTKSGNDYFINPYLKIAGSPTASIAAVGGRSNTLLLDRGTNTANYFAVDILPDNLEDGATYTLSFKVYHTAATAQQFQAAMCGAKEGGAQYTAYATSNNINPEAWTEVTLTGIKLVKEQGGIRIQFVNGVTGNIYLDDIVITMTAPPPVALTITDGTYTKTTSGTTGTDFSIDGLTLKIDGKTFTFDATHNEYKILNALRNDDTVTFASNKLSTIEIKATEGWTSDKVYNFNGADLTGLFPVADTNDELIATNVFYFNGLKFDNKNYTKYQFKQFSWGAQITVQGGNSVVTGTASKTTQFFAQTYSGDLTLDLRGAVLGTSNGEITIEKNNNNVTVMVPKSHSKLKGKKDVAYKLVTDTGDVWYTIANASLSNSTSAVLSGDGDITETSLTYNEYYTVTAQQTPFIIKQDLPEASITSIALTTSYDGKPKVVTATYTGVTEAEAGAIMVYYGDGSTMQAPTNVGTYDIYVTTAGGTHYNHVLPERKIGTLTITPAELDIVDIDVADKAYESGNKDATVTFAFDGAVDGETFEKGTDYTVEAEFESDQVGTDKTVTGTVTSVTGGKLKNYLFKNGLAYATFTSMGTITSVINPEPSEDVVKNLTVTASFSSLAKASQTSLIISGGEETGAYYISKASDMVDFNVTDASISSLQDDYSVIKEIGDEFIADVLGGADNKRYNIVQVSADGDKIVATGTSLIALADVSAAIAVTNSTNVDITGFEVEGYATTTSVGNGATVTIIVPGTTASIIFKGQNVATTTSISITEASMTGSVEITEWNYVGATTTSVSKLNISGTSGENTIKIDGVNYTIANVATLSSLMDILDNDDLITFYMSGNVSAVKLTSTTTDYEFDVATASSIIFDLSAQSVKASFTSFVENATYSSLVKVIGESSATVTIDENGVIVIGGASGENVSVYVDINGFAEDELKIKNACDEKTLNLKYYTASTETATAYSSGNTANACGFTFATANENITIAGGQSAGVVLVTITNGDTVTVKKTQ